MPKPCLSADDTSGNLGVPGDLKSVWVADQCMSAHKLGRLWTF